MKEKFLVTLFFVLGALYVQAQDSIRYRIILIGDAGEIDQAQHAVIPAAAACILQNRTTVMFLGDNIYPRGMGLAGSKEEEQTKKILQSQFIPMRNGGAQVYFVPGNHDWDRMGPQGLEKIKAQWAYVDAQHDSLLRLMPPNGCPDPVEINVSDSLTIIAFDSEWWLFPFGTDNPGAACSCKTKKDIILRLQELLFKNRYKVILLASHHPFQSYGTHGGYYSLKDHIFPFTALYSNLYIPLPVMGSLYPFLRKTFPSPEDMGHPLYKTMMKQIDDVFEGFPNLVHVAGHDHGLQFIKDKQVQVVSGAGAKTTVVKKGKHSLFADATAGFVTADLLSGNSMRFTYYTNSDSRLRASFTFTQPYTSVKTLEDSVYATITADSLEGVAHAGFGEVSKLHRIFFGANYRREWSAPTKLPVIRISEFRGGLTPLREGGGNQTHSLRLEDKEGTEWVLRSVEKYPDAILPEQLKETFAKDIVTDAMSAQHPYSALVVPPIAHAVKVPHAHPIIGIVAPDKNLGMYSKMFAGTVCLLEEREPTGKSDNFTTMLNELSRDNDNNFDSTVFLRARILDVLLGDWDRHGDQWRFKPEKNGKGKRYTPIPRDRDQVFYTNQGIFPYIESRPWVQPFFEGFNPSIRKVGTLLFTSTLLNARLINQFSYDQWMQVTHEFVAGVTDSVLETALRQLPKSAYELRHNALLKILKARRDDLPRAMSAYYYFLNKNAFIRSSDKNELVEIRDAPLNGMQISIHKLSKKGEVKEQLFSKVYYPSITREIRLFIGKGDDSVFIDNNNSSIKLRITGGDGNKKYQVIESKRKVDVFEKENNAVFSGNTGRLVKHLSNDSANTAIVPGNLFNVLAPLATAGFNRDDGFILGAGFRYTRGLDYTQTGFNTKRYTSFQELTVAHSFSTNAFSIKYNAEWAKAIGNADFTLHADALAPNNTQNFFGTGNETPFYKTGDYKRFYRARFSLYTIDPALRWGSKKGSFISVGPSVQYYHFDSTDNAGRFILDNNFTHTYDSATIAKDKMHAGLAIGFVSDKRNNKLLPRWGSYVNVKLLGYTGLNSYSKSFARLTAELAFYKSVDAKSNFVIAERLGGGAIVGNETFYQSLFLGGQGNLLGYRQYRFAGQYMLYNNLEARIKLADLASYILPGQVGLVGLFDVGRVWEEHDQSDLWHIGAGGGLYFAPAQIAVFQLVFVHSREGLYPYVTIGLRF